MNEKVKESVIAFEPSRSRFEIKNSDFGLFQ